jgi:putative transcriptional regulator
MASHQTFGDDLITSLTQALDHAQGKSVGVRETIIDIPDVRAIREGLNLSQSEFDIPLATLKGWEQGWRHPDATASAYLNVIARIPTAAREALGGFTSSVA